MLTEIIKYKYEEIKNIKLPEFDRSLNILDFKKGILGKSLILEIKRKTPSNRLLGNNQSIKNRAISYKENGAGCISILTDNKFFSGSFEDIKLVKNYIEIPVLCKEFIVDEIQIEKAYLFGSDAILLIACVHSSVRLKQLYKKALSLGLQVLFELHDLDEFEKIKNLNLEMVGINSRNLNTFEIDLNKCGKKIEKLNGDFIKVAESGIKSKEDIKFLRKKGADGFLIGSYLMKGNNLKGKIKELSNGLED